MFEYLPPLNDHNLPYPDTIHPIVVHFVIAMVLFAFFCDFIGYFTKNSRLYEVGWWNLFFSTIAIFIAVIFGQIEAGLSLAYNAVESTLNLHTIIGWFLSALLAGITGWRFVIRTRDPQVLPTSYLSVSLLLVGIVCFQTYLGDKLVWIFGLHTIPVVDAIREGTLQ
jgi:uncharacterized membrane protein